MKLRALSRLWPLWLFLAALAVALCVLAPAWPQMLVLHRNTDRLGQRVRARDIMLYTLLVEKGLIHSRARSDGHCQSRTYSSDHGSGTAYPFAAACPDLGLLVEILPVYPVHCL